MIYTRGKQLREISNLNPDSVVNFLKCKAEKFIMPAQSAAFEQKSVQIMSKHFHFAKYFSSSLSFSNLRSFNEWHKDIASHKETYLLFLICKMLHGNKIAFAHYLNLEKDIYELDLLPQSTTDSDLIEFVISTGFSNMSNYAKLNAYFWLTSKEAEAYLCIDKECVMSENQEVALKLTGIVCGDSVFV